MKTRNSGSDSFKKCILTTHDYNKYGSSPVMYVKDAVNTLYNWNSGAGFCLQPDHVSPSNDFNHQKSVILHAKNTNYTQISSIVRTESDANGPHVWDCNDGTVSNAFKLYDEETVDGKDYSLALNNIMCVNLSVMQPVYTNNMRTNTIAIGDINNSTVEVNTGKTGYKINGDDIPFIKVKNKGTAAITCMTSAELIFGYSSFYDYTDKTATSNATRADTSWLKTFIVIPTFAPGFTRVPSTSNFFGYWRNNIPQEFANLWSPTSQQYKDIESYHPSLDPGQYKTYPWKKGEVASGVTQPFYIYYVRCSLAGFIYPSSSTIDNSRVFGLPAIAVKGQDTWTKPLIAHTDQKTIYHSFTLLDAKIAVTYNTI